MTFNQITRHQSLLNEARRIVLTDPNKTTVSLRQLAWKVLTGQVTTIRMDAPDPNTPMVA